ncbi:3-hydroxyacyl-CoA dehydrogenase family protein [Tumebacillus permanentifrigoris]|uniref:3-hydroxybutyryl-CoA dehydrogenase n=1 Tax=Tumebacillus permanentifrigoris TaxID=378543 RepID=A0A316D4B5_9BACL|nr:3-hydroxyacyl-CoA dehydrogenase family protein [Tumebacillus permanentifrigoris]PWK07021.1 3-hydroxybutyryl-CoA dehydrogenase [Tumebacillus permanentifrigoris]
MVQKITVIGSGVMGHGIAQLYAVAGYTVTVHDIRPELLEQASILMENNLDLLVQEGVLTQQATREARRRIQFTTDLEAAVHDADFITEVIPEVLELKWELYAKLELLAKPDAIIASNTSTFPIAQLIEKATTSHRMIITHFFNPAQLVPLVEVVKHDVTSDEVVATTLDLMRAIGKEPVLLKKDVPGFIANRLQAALVREAFHLLKEGVASARDIDTAVTAGPGFRWAFVGPIETVDYGGLDTWKRVLDNLAPVLDKQESAPALLNELVQAGKLGTKSGEGVYSYADTAETSDVAAKIKERDTRYIRLAKIKKP